MVEKIMEEEYGISESISEMEDRELSSGETKELEREQLDFNSIFEEYEDEEDYAYEYVEQCYDLPEFAKTYFDYSAFARDLFMTDYWMDNGFVFRCA